MLRNKLWLGVLAILIVVVGIWAYKRSRLPNSNDLPIVTITQIATHPALDEVRAGLIEGLKKRGYEDGKTVTIVFKNANGDPSLTLPIAQEFVRMRPSVIVPISTPSTLSV